MNEKFIEKLEKNIGKTRQTRQHSRQKVIAVEKTDTTYKAPGGSDDYRLACLVIFEEKGKEYDYYIEYRYAKGNREMKNIGKTAVRPQFPPDSFIEVANKANQTIKKHCRLI